MALSRSLSYVFSISSCHQPKLLKLLLWRAGYVQDSYTVYDDVVCIINYPGNSMQLQLVSNLLVN